MTAMILLTAVAGWALTGFAIKPNTWFARWRLTLDDTAGMRISPYLLGLPFVTALYFTVLWLERVLSFYRSWTFALLLFVSFSALFVMTRRSLKRRHRQQPDPSSG